MGGEGGGEVGRREGGWEGQRGRGGGRGKEGERGREGGREEGGHLTTSLLHVNAYMCTPSELLVHVRYDTLYIQCTCTCILTGLLSACPRCTW